MGYGCHGQKLAGSFELKNKAVNIADWILWRLQIPQATKEAADPSSCKGGYGPARAKEAE